MKYPRKTWMKIRQFLDALWADRYYLIGVVLIASFIFLGVEVMVSTYMKPMIRLYDRIEELELTVEEIGETNAMLVKELEKLGAVTVAIVSAIVNPSQAPTSLDPPPPEPIWVGGLPSKEHPVFPEERTWRNCSVCHDEEEL